MNKAITVLSGILILAGAASGYDPPEIIGILTSPQENPAGFACDFCWIGDQNGDGFDDLLVNQDRFPNDTLSRVYLYHGREAIENEPSFTYTSYERDLVIGRSVVYLGFIQDRNQPPILGFASTVPDQSIRIDLYERLQEPEENPISTFLIGEFGRTPAIDDGFRNRPIDFNGDGFNDIIVMKASVGFQVHYGGEDLDTLADWSRYLYTPYWSSGLDINNDGFGDILIYTQENNVEWYSIYLGGNPPDTLPAVRVSEEEYSLGGSANPYFAMLPDINGDGYDEWGSYWNYIHQGPDDPRPDDAGFYIFMGSEEPDGVPDLLLEDTPDPWMGRGPICGSDFNGDGYGDIVVKTGGSDEDHGQDAEFQFHFGSPWVAETGLEIKRQPDLFVDLGREYDGVYAHTLSDKIGAVGDYNGDGVDDFVWSNQSQRMVIIFAGNCNWEVGVESEAVTEQYDITLTASPNPFNNRTMLEFTLPQAGNARLAVYDLKGKEAGILADTHLQRGDHRYFWINRTAGVYFAVLRTDSKTEIVKMVCLM